MRCVRCVGVGVGVGVGVYACFICVTVCGLGCSGPDPRRVCPPPTTALSTPTVPPCPRPLLPIHPASRYWDEFFRDWERRSGDSAFEWYGSWKDIAPHVIGRLPAGTPRDALSVLVVGCGNSSLSADMHGAGFTNVVSIDFSEGVIGRMRAQHTARPSLRWEVMDAKAMTFPDGTFDLVVDKVRWPGPASLLCMWLSLLCCVCARALWAPLLEPCVFGWWHFCVGCTRAPLTRLRPARQSCGRRRRATCWQCLLRWPGL